MKKIIILNKKDNVAVLLFDAKKGDFIENLTVAQDIPYGHKIALCDIKKGENIYKYGEIIGECTQDIAKGKWAHVHNIKSIRGVGK